MSGGTLEMTERSSDRAVVLGPGEGQAVWFLANLMVVKATAATTNGGYGLVESLVPPGSSPPLHIHEREDETFYVLEGALRVRCGDDIYDAPQGSYIFLPRGVPHTFRVESATPARLLTLITPGGGEGVFVDGGRPAERPTLPPPGAPDLKRLQEVALGYGAIFVGPPLGPREPAV